MKKLTMLILLGLSLGSQTLYAGESGDKIMSFWDRLRAKIESFAPQKKSSVTTATGGVRGAQVASDDIYWKNEATSETIAAEELEAFTKAVKLADTNDKTQAQTAFSEFIRKYPESALRKDADQALALLESANTPAK